MQTTVCYHGDTVFDTPHDKLVLGQISFYCCLIKSHEICLICQLIDRLQEQNSCHIVKMKFHCPWYGIKRYRKNLCHIDNTDRQINAIPLGIKSLIISVCLLPFSDLLDRSEHDLAKKSSYFNFSPSVLCNIFCYVSNWNLSQLAVSDVTSWNVPSMYSVFSLMSKKWEHDM